MFGVHTLGTTLHEAMATVADEHTLDHLQASGELDVPGASFNVTVHHKEEEAMSDHDNIGELGAAPGAVRALPSPQRHARRPIALPPPPFCLRFR